MNVQHIEHCLSVCKHCLYWENGCSLLHNPSSIITDIVEGCRCPSDFYEGIYEAPALHQDTSDTLLITFHFNPCKFHALRETYYQWLPTLGVPVSCYELVFDDDEPEIENSIVIRGTRSQNFLWQKEALINHALQHAPSNIRYFGWLDHDICFSHPNWLNEAKAKIDAGTDALQLFDKLHYMTPNGRIANTVLSSVPFSQGNPGGAWLANRAWLDEIGGLPSAYIVGSGDYYFYWMLKGQVPDRSITLNHLEYYIDTMLRIQSTDPQFSYLTNTSFHIYHGELQQRQYKTREQILVDNNYNPYTDIRVSPSGLLEWSSDKPQMHQQVKHFFQMRKEDE